MPTQREPRGGLAGLAAAVLAVCCGLPILLGAGVAIGTVGAVLGSAAVIAVGAAVAVWGWRRRRDHAREGEVPCRPTGFLRQMRTKPWLVVAGVALAALVVAAVLAAPDTGDSDEASSDGGEAVSFEMLDGTTGSLADYRGRPLVLNFFASWCVPCLVEMPGFERVHQDLRAEVAFLGMNLQDGVEAGQRVVDQTGVSYDIARDPDGAVFRSFGGVAMPSTVFIDADGRVVDVHSGEVSAGALRDRIDDLLLS